MNKYSNSILTAFALILLSSCSSPNQPGDARSDAAEKTNSAPAKIIETTTDKSDVKNTINLSACLDNCGVVKQDTGLISKETCQTGCYMTEAQEKKDPELCISKITDPLMLSTCLTGVAESMGDVKVCDRIGTDNADLFRGACYISVAEKIGDTSVCEGIKGSMMYMGCTDTTKEE